MNWKRHSLATHIAGCKEGKEVKGRLLKGVLDCFPNDIISCPISDNDTFKDGIYYRKDLGSFIKVSGNWYKYSNGRMFEYYQDEMDVNELSKKEQESLTIISKTKFATKYQKRLAYAIQGLIEVKQLILDMKKMHLPLRKKILTIKEKNKI